MFLFMMVTKKCISYKLCLIEAQNVIDCLYLVHEELSRTEVFLSDEVKRIQKQNRLFSKIDRPGRNILHFLGGRGGIYNFYCTCHTLKVENILLHQKIRTRSGTTSTNESHLFRRS